MRCFDYHNYWVFDGRPGFSSENENHIWSTLASCFFKKINKECSSWKGKERRAWVTDHIKQFTWKVRKIFNIPATAGEGKASPYSHKSQGGSPPCKVEHNKTVFADAEQEDPYPVRPNWGGRRVSGILQHSRGRIGINFAHERPPTYDSREKPYDYAAVYQGPYAEVPHR